MKKLLMLVFCAAMLGTNSFARERVPLTVYYEDPSSLGNGHSLSPIIPPSLYIEDYVLSFAANHPEYVLNIKDEDGEIVYTTVVTSTETEVTLPSTLSGDYQIELVMGNWKFTGYINL